MAGLVQNDQGDGSYDEYVEEKYLYTNTPARNLSKVSTNLSQIYSADSSLDQIISYKRFADHLNKSQDISPLLPESPKIGPNLSSSLSSSNESLNRGLSTSSINSSASHQENDIKLDYFESLGENSLIEPIVEPYLERSEFDENCFEIKSTQIIHMNKNKSLKTNIDKIDILKTMTIEPIIDPLLDISTYSYSNLSERSDLIEPIIEPDLSPTNKDDILDKDDFKFNLNKDKASSLSYFYHKKLESSILNLEPNLFKIVADIRRRKLDQAFKQVTSPGTERFQLQMKKLNSYKK